MCAREDPPSSQSQLVHLPGNHKRILAGLQKNYTVFSGFLHRLPFVLVSIAENNTLYPHHGGNGNDVHVRLNGYMKTKVFCVFLSLIALILFGKGALSIQDFSTGRFYEIYYMLDSELHTWVGHDSYVDIPRDDFEQLRSVIQRNENYVGNLRQRISELEHQKSELTDQIEDFKNQLSNKDRTIKELQEQKSALTDQITTLTASVSFLKGLLEEKDQKIAKLEQDIQLKNQHISNLNDQISELNDLLDTKNEENTILASLASAPATITEVFKENRQLKKRLELAEASITTLEEEIQKKDEQLSQTETQLKQMDS